MNINLKKLAFQLLLLVSFICHSQEIEVKGTIVDENAKTPIEFATVQIESTKNHRLLGYSFTNEKGEFDIEVDLKKETDVSLVVTYIGYTTYKKSISINNHHLSVGTILLHLAPENLEEIVLTATPPVLIKKDTIQYNAASFKTKEDAVAEDLLKKLPGVSIDNENGSIQVNGVDVTKILVNGEPFFSDNPKVAMKILTKDVIDKIQITDTKSDEENFTGTSNDEEAKTINITLKKKKRGNIFGNVTAGYGTNDRYETNGVVNRMYKKSLLTVLGFSNNVNKNNFSYSDDDDANTLDRLKAIKTESNIGANYSNKFKNNDKINTDYLFSDTEYDKKFSIDRIILLPENTNFSTENSDQKTTQQIHKGNLKLTNNLFENFRLITNASFFKRDKLLTRKNDRIVENQESVLINDNESDLFQNQRLQNINTSISALYKFEKLNSFLNAKVFTTNNSTENGYHYTSETNFYGNNPRQVLRDQSVNQDRKDTRLSTSVKYGQKIKDHRLELEFINRDETLKDTKNVTDFDNDSNTFIDNTSLSYRQKINVTKQEQKIAYIFKKKNFLYRFNASNVKTIVDNQEFTKDIGLKRTFENLLVSTKLRVNTKNGWILSANYRTKNIVPRNHELLTITDNTNPTRINIGNPDLDIEIEHLLSFNIRNYNRKSKLYFFNRFSYSTVNDKIIDKTTIDEDLITTKTYINNSENQRYTITGSIAKDYKKDPLFYSLKFKWYTTFGNDAHFINNEAFQSNYVRISPSFYTEINYNDWFEINPYYRLFLDSTKYNTDSVQDQNNIQHTYGLNITTFAPKRFTLFNQLQYTFNPKFEKGLGRKALVWNITANYNIVPNKAKIKLTVFNLLNQYNNTNRTLTESKNSTFSYNLLQQYAMLSFKYTFKN